MPIVSEQPGEAPEVDALAEQPRLSLTYDELVQEERIGTGGNADVFRARVEGSGAVVALKVPRIQGTLTASAVEQFLEEAETWGKLDDHPHVVSLVDWGDEPLPWLAMEYMDAGHLGERVGAVSLREGVWICSRVARAVRHAHRRGVAHLDLKPENVLFRSTAGGTWDLPKVSDWGLAKLLLEHSQSVEGLSPQYAAPEQFDADAFGRPDNHTDIWQLGVVAYELLTGQRPFDGGHAAVMRAIMDEDPAPPSEVADVPPAVDDAIMPALAKQKADRYEDVLLFRDALDDLLADLDAVSDSRGSDRGSAGRRGARDDGERTDGEVAESIEAGAEAPSEGSVATGTADLSEPAPSGGATEPASPTPDDGGPTADATEPDAGSRAGSGLGEARGREGASDGPRSADTTGQRLDSPGDVADRVLSLVTTNVATTAIAVAVLLGLARVDSTLLPGSVFVPSLGLTAAAGLLFGLPGVLGSALGSLLADVLWFTVGFLTPVSMVAEAAVALVPYALWHRMGPLSDGEPPDFRTRRGQQLVKFLLFAVVSSIAVAALIAGGLSTRTSQIEFFQFFESVFVTNLVSIAVVGPPVLYLLYPRVARYSEERGD